MNETCAVCGATGPNVVRALYGLSPDQDVYACIGEHMTQVRAGLRDPSANPPNYTGD